MINDSLKSLDIKVAPVDPVEAVKVFELFEAAILGVLNLRRLIVVPLPQLHLVDCIAEKKLGDE